MMRFIQGPTFKSFKRGTVGWDVSESERRRNSGVRPAAGSPRKSFGHRAEAGGPLLERLYGREMAFCGNRPDQNLALDGRSNHQHRVEKWETTGVWTGETVDHPPQVTTKHQLRINLIIHFRWIT